LESTKPKNIFERQQTKKEMNIRFRRPNKFLSIAERKTQKQEDKR
jgi:hypothetical protein